MRHEEYVSNTVSTYKISSTRCGLKRAALFEYWLPASPPALSLRKIQLHFNEDSGYGERAKVCT
jgi:hypothetical protein